MIEVVQVKNRNIGNLKAHDKLRQLVDSETLIALSGGTSPDYQKMIVEPGDILPGSVCVVDERWGEKRHIDSNEYLMEKAGLLSYLKTKGIGFHNIQWEGDIIADACDYDGLVKKLFARFPKKVGVMGVGTNLHTAGIFPKSIAAHSPDLVVGETVNDKFPKRITLTLKALGEFQNFVILVFGEEKHEVVKIMLDENENDMQKYPAIFYRKCFAKCWLITDQDLK